MGYEYRVVPAPRKGEKGRGLKSSEDRFAFALTNLMNTLGAQGWEYQRADALPCDERSGLTGTKTTFHNVLVFRRPLDIAEGELSTARTTLPVAPAPFTAVPDPQSVAAPVLGAAVQPLGAAPALGPANTDD